jgi:hypothetical protein
MVSQCPHCEKTLQLNEAQQEKIRSALANLKAGTLKLGCPHCKQAIHLNKDGSLAGTKKVVARGVGGAPSAAPPKSSLAIEPPTYPDISWLVDGIYKDKEVVADVLKVLVLMPEGPARDFVAKTFTDMGYLAEFPESAEDAMAQMRFVPVAAVVLHTEFDGEPAASQFHKHMANMPMGNRRLIYYVLVGKGFSTLYDLEALTYSANIVVNDSEIEHIDSILEKGMQDYMELFGPYLESLKAAAS